MTDTPDPATILVGLARERNGPYDLTVERARIADACRLLRDRGGYEHLSLITGIDWKRSWEVVYHLVRLGQREVLTLRCALPRHDPTVPSIASVWPGASWHERETYDLLGITFTGTPDPRRILLPQDFRGHPLRKDVSHGNSS